MVIDLVSLISTAINNSIKKATDQEALRIIGKVVSEDIKERTIDGYGVDKKGQSKKKLKPLKQSTINRRKREKLAANTSASTSNLTRSGAMISSVDYQVFSQKVEIDVSNKNARKAKENKNLGRNFLELSAENMKDIKELIVNRFVKFFKI